MKKILHLILIVFIFIGCAANEPKPQKEVELTVDNYYDNTKDGKVMVLFYLPRDPNSQEMLETFKKIDFEKRGIKVYKVDIIKGKDLYLGFRLEYVPTVFYLKDSKKIKQTTGAKTPKQLKEILKIYEGK